MNMMSKITLVLVAALLAVGCQNGNGKDAVAAKHPHGEEVCELPGEGKDVVKVEPAKPRAPAQVATFGGEPSMTDQAAVPVAIVLADPAAYKDKKVKLAGKVSSVCVKKGCWVRVVPDKPVVAANKAPTTQPMHDIFIKFRDPPAGRLIPMEAAGKNVTVEGTLKMGMMKEAAARHFLEDGGAPQSEIEKIVGPQPQLVLQQAVVMIEGVEKPQAE